MKTIGKGTTGTGANTVGPDGGLYTSQTQTGLDNNGYGTIPSGTKATDTDGDGMPECFGELSRELQWKYRVWPYVLSERQWWFAIP